jgi:hypothetical protein
MRYRLEYLIGSSLSAPTLRMWNDNTLSCLWYGAAPTAPDDIAVLDPQAMPRSDDTAARDTRRMTPRLRLPDA